MIQFANYIGQTIPFLIPRIDREAYQSFKLVGVETGGVWVESQEVTNFVLTQHGVAAAPKTLVFFVSFHEIAFAFAPSDSPSLNEKAFGL